MQPSNFSKVLKAVEKMIGKKIKSFLKSKQGEIWFESAISAYIFPRNIPYKTNYAERKGLPLIEDAEVLQLDKAVQAALKIDIDDVIVFVQDFFKKEPLFWLESDSEGNEFVDTLKQSKLYNRF
jgi:hypothetical protein